MISNGQRYTNCTGIVSLTTTLSLQAMLVELKKFKDHELPEKVVKRQELTETEKKLLVWCELIRVYDIIMIVCQAQKVEIPSTQTVAEMDKVWRLYI